MLSLPLRFRTRTRDLRKRAKLVLVACLKVPAIRLLVRTARELSDDDATHMAAGVSYYAILSLFPLTVGLIFVLSFILESDRVEAELLEFIQTYFPGSTETLGDNIRAIEGIRGILGLVSVVGLFWSASAAFGAISRAINRAWDVHQDRPFYIAKLHHLTMAISVGVLFLLSLGATTSLQVVGSLNAPGIGQIAFLDDYGLTIIGRVLPFIFTLAIFLLIYKFVPNTTTYWRYIFPGAVLAAVAFELGKSLFVYYLDNFVDYEKVYGSLGSMIALLIWTYMSALILIAGAEFSSEYGRMREGVGRGKRIADAKPRRGRTRR